MDQMYYLKPDLHTEYLKKGLGQETTYLQVTQKMDIEDLRRRVKNRAKQFKGVLELAEKKPARFVIISCDNREEGLMAVSYLAAIYNQKDADTNEDYDDESDEYDIYYDIDVEDEDDSQEWEIDSWVEDRWKIPVVDTMRDRRSILGDTFGTSPIAYGQAGENRSEVPYWYSVRRENICFITDGLLSVKYFRRHQHNRHVYLVLPKTENLCNPYLSLGCAADRLNETLSDLVIEYQAEIVDVKADGEIIKKYYEDLFQSWVAYKGYKLARNFPVGRIVAHIMGYNTSNKSAFMEKAIGYVARDLKDGCTLREKDFSILNRFTGLAMEEPKEEKRGTRTLDMLDTELIGLENVKKQIHGIVAVMKQNKLRKKRGLKEGTFHNTHMLIGAPGTAKTTVAKLLGTIMVEEGLLPHDKFISINGAELKGKYVGHSAPKVKELFENYDIILIDEAYSLASEGSDAADSFSQEAVAQLVIELEEHSMDKLVLFAGYGGMSVSMKDNRMKQFLDMNPGIKSRINTTMYFESYNSDQMVQIFLHKAVEGEYIIRGDVERLVKEYFEERVSEPDFGNGREARSLLENAAAEAAKRMLDLAEDKITTEMLQEIRAEDISNAIKSLRAATMTQTGVTACKIGFAAA